jgi:tetratricopeptide (TPR) repeat protein
MADRTPHYQFTTSEIPAFDFVWDLGDNSLIERAFYKILQHRVRDNLAAQALTQLARSQGLQGKFDLAMKTLDSSRLRSNDAIFHIRYLLEYGRALRSSGKPKDAAPYFKKAYEAAVGVEDFYAVDAAHMLAISDPTTGPTEGRTWFEEALDTARKSTHPPTQGWAAIILNSTAWNSFDQGDYQTALDCFNEVTEFRRIAVDHKETPRSKEGYRIVRWSTAYTLRHMDRLEDAYTIQKQLLSEDNTYLYREELAILAEKLGHTSEAEEHKKALEAVEAKYRRKFVIKWVQA